MTDAPKAPRAEARAGEDPYAWLRDEQWQAVIADPAKLSPAIRAYLEAENAYTDRVLAPLASLRTALVAEMRARIKEDDSTVPVPDGPFAYYSRHVPGGQHPIFCRSPRNGGAETVLLDGNAAAAGLAYFRVGSLQHSPDHRRLAWTVDTAGSEIFTLYVRDLDGGALIGTPVTGVHGGSVAWANDNATLFYTQLDAQHRPTKVFRHTAGATGADVLVYEEKDAAFYLGLGKTESEKFIVIGASSHANTSESWLIDADAPLAPPVLVEPRAAGIDYDVSHRGDTLYIRTNADGAEDYKIVTAPAATPGRAQWRDLVVHRAGVLIRGLELYRDWLVRSERADALPRIVVRQLETGAEHTIVFDEEAYDLSPQGGMEFAGETLRFSYSSMATPSSVFDYAMASRTRTLRKRQDVPSGHNPDDYVVRRIQAPARDGEAVPVSILYRKGTPLDGSAPLLLYGYGSYGISIPPAFSTNRLSLVDRGIVYAIAHIRGGMDKGFRWYREGKLTKKLNTFHDFIDAGEALVRQGFTARGRIAINGGSAGGLLVGASINMRPDLFRAAVAEVPFVDVLATISDATLPLTPPEWSEWGNPLEDAAARALLGSYSPYDNVQAQAYPDLLATAGISDPRVTYWEPAKWIAKLRAHDTGQATILLKTNMGAGHGGAAGRFDRLEEVALTYAFVLRAFGEAGA